MRLNYISKHETFRFEDIISSHEDFSIDAGLGENNPPNNVRGFKFPSTGDSKKNTMMDDLVDSVENMQKSVNQLAAVVGAVNQVTPSPALSVATTSRRSVDIDSLIAQKDRNNKSKSRKNNRKTKNRGGCLDMFYSLNNCRDISYIASKSYIFLIQLRTL